MAKPSRTVCPVCRKMYSRAYIHKHKCTVKSRTYRLPTKIIGNIIQERMRQNELHPTMLKEERMAILAEEVGEVAKALNEKDLENLEVELTQVSATAIRWLEYIELERRKRND